MTLSSTPSPSDGPRAPAMASVTDLAARLDRLPVVTGSHRLWAGLLGFFFLFDTFDLSAFGNTAPALRAEWGLTIGQVSLATSAAFVGMFFGALIGGRASDRWGRRPVLLAGAATYSLFSLATALAPNFETLVVLRLLTGIGMQATTGVLLVYVSEMFPRHLRGRYQAILLTIGIVGVPLAAFVARMVTPWGEGAWRWVYAVGALGIVGTVVAVKLLPESARWAAAHGRADRAEALVTRLEDEAKAATGAPLPEPQPLPAPRTGSFGELLGRPYLKRTAVASVAMVLLILSIYGFNSWVATLLVERGFAQTTALTMVTILAIASVPGAFLPYFFVDRFERKDIILTLAVLSAAAVAVFGFVANPVAMVVAGFVFSVFMQSIVAVLYTYLPEIYPTHLRGVGSGIANGLGRVAGVAGAFIVGGIFTAFGFTTVFVYLAVVVLLLGIVLALFGERTTARSLEQISG